MSNPTDPTRPSPDQPDPKNPEEHLREPTGRSSFEFSLPEGVESYSDLPPVPQDERLDSALVNEAAVPPRPEGLRPGSKTFDFIDLPDVEVGPHSSVTLQNVPITPTPAEPVELPDESATLPEVPRVPAGPSDSTVGFGPGSDSDPVSFKLSSSDLDLGSVLPPIPEPASTATSVPDIASLFPSDSPGSDVRLDDPGSITLGRPPASDTDLPMAEPLSDVFANPLLSPASSESPLGAAEPVKAELIPDEPQLSEPVGEQLRVTPLGDWGLPEPTVGELFPAAEPASADLAPDQPVEPASSWFDQPVAPAEEVPPQGAAPGAPGPRSSFDFHLPEGVESYSELPPVPQPNVDATGDFVAALPPRPEAARPGANTFDFVDLAEDGGPSLAKIGPTPTPIDPVEPPAEAVESSDIFSGNRDVPTAEPGGLSDVLAATAFRPAAPSAGGEAPDDDGSRVPLASVADSSVNLTAGDSASIHDIPDPASLDPLFDSANLTDAADQAAAGDSPDYGAPPVGADDASSILADLSNPDLGVPGDSSSVSVEAPGGSRHDEPAFELTVPDEPIPADMFEEGADSSGSDLTGGPRSSSDLFIDARSSPEIDLTAAPPDDAPPSQSSIFSGAPDRDSDPSDLHEAAYSDESVELADFPEVDAAEFTDHPAAGLTAERDRNSPPKLARPPHGLSSAEFEIPPEMATPVPAARGDDGEIDWDAVDESDDASRGAPQDASISGLLDSLKDDSAESVTKDARPVDAAPTDHTGEPIVTVDWMAGSAEGSAVMDPAKTDPEFGMRPRPRDRKERAKRPDKTPAAPAPARAPKPPRAAEETATGDTSRTGEKLKPREKSKKGGGVLVGLVAGAVLAGGACAGAYFGGLVPNSEKVTQKPPVQAPPGAQPVPGPNPPAAASPQFAFAAGDFARALELLKGKSADTADERATAGRVRVYAKATGAGTDDDLKQGRDDLRAVINDADQSPEAASRAVQAYVDLGISHELAGDREAAKRVYAEAKGKFPARADIFDALLSRLDARPAGGGTSFNAPRLTPAEMEAVLLSVGILLADDAPKADQPEPGVYYWKAVKLAGEGDYAEAVDLIGKAKAAHVARAKAFAGRGLNPLTDPLEEMFPRSCDELAALWKLKAELYRNPGVADAIKKDGLGKTLDALAGSQKELAAAKAELKTASADLKSVQGELKAAQSELKTATDNLAAAKTDLKKATDDLATAKADLKKATDNLATSETDLKAAADKVKKLETDVAKLDKDAKSLAAAKLTAEKKLDAALTDAKAVEKKLAAAADDLQAAQKDAKAKGEVISGIAAALKPAVTLPEKWTPEDLAAAAKTLATVASNKDLKGLAEKLTKAEAAAKVATDKLAAETKKLNEKYDADTAKLKTDHATELKKLADTYAADLKTLKAGHAVAVDKLKDAGAADLKKLTEKYEADAKQLADDQKAAVKKLTDKYADAVKAEQDKTAAATKAVELRELAVQKQLANVITPSQALDIWLPILTDLRRPVDADPALEIAKRALNGTVPGTDDEGKAHTVKGMAYLLKGEYAAAKDEFQAARRVAAYKEDKQWAKVAEAGLKAVDDPLALYRQPVVAPAVDAALAAKSLDAGIVAFKSGGYEAAEKALLDAAKNDPADPVAWYYLGATRWALGKEDQAREDFAQGSERERSSPRPARVVSAALSPLQGEVRSVLDKARP